jgi:hypothetical protein
MISFSGGLYIAGRPLDPNRDPQDSIRFVVRSYSIMLGEIYPYPHQWYHDLHLQGILDCFGKQEGKFKERLTVCFLPFDWSPTKPLTDFTNYGGMIFVGFKDIQPYIDLVRNYPVMATISEMDPRYNRLFTTQIQKRVENAIEMRMEKEGRVRKAAGRSLARSKSRRSK